MGLIIGLGNRSSGSAGNKEIIVTELPETGVSGVYYILQPEGSDNYSVFIWIDPLSDWYQISSPDAIPTKVSQLINDKHYVAAQVDDEDNEMLKFNV